jgi:hypothetical protein
MPSMYSPVFFACPNRCVEAGAGVGVEQQPGLVLGVHVPKTQRQDEVLEDVGVVAGVEGVAIAEHG